MHACPAQACEATLCCAASYLLSPAATAAWSLLPLPPASNCYCRRTAVLQYCRDRKHAKPMWFCVVSCHILWFTFTKAILNVIKKKVTGETSQISGLEPGKAYLRLLLYIACTVRMRDCML